MDDERPVSGGGSPRMMHEMTVRSERGSHHTTDNATIGARSASNTMGGSAFGTELATPVFCGTEEPTTPSKTGGLSAMLASMNVLPATAASIPSQWI